MAEKGRGIFLARGVDGANQVGIVWEIAVGKHGRAVRTKGRLKPLITRIFIYDVCDVLKASLDFIGARLPIGSWEIKGRVACMAKRGETLRAHEISFKNGLMNVRRICNRGP